MAKELSSFQNVIAAALAAIKDLGGVTAQALPARFDGAGQLAPYKGTNVLLLAMAGKDLPSSIWGTANALRDATGCLVAKGQTSMARVIFAGLKDAPAKKEDPLLAKEVSKEPEDPTLPKGKVRVYRTIASFNASQLGGVDLAQILEAPSRPDAKAVHETVLQVLGERAAHPGPGEKPLDQRLMDGVMACVYTMLDWRYGKRATLSSGWFESAGDLLTIAGVAQSCVDALNLQPGFYAYGVPKLVDPAEMAGLPEDAQPACPVEPAPQAVKDAATSTASPKLAAPNKKEIKTAEEALAVFLGKELDLGW